MREIKFRAWSNGRMITFDYNDSNYYLELDSLSSAQLVEIEEKGLWDRYMSKEYPQDVVLMQYTGLKDMNSKEIYEGDIISDNVGIGKVEYRETRAGYRVTYKDGTAKWFLDYTTNEFQSIEVIGNIYENPNRESESHENDQV